MEAMDSFLVAAQVALAAVFTLAGVTKLLDLPGSRRAMVDFGLSTRAAAVAGSILPFAELGTAVALLLHPSARWGGLAALVLLLAFIAAIANAMRRGRAPDCHCFGQVQSSPAGPRTLARNMALAGLATIVLVSGPGPALDDWVAGRTAAELVAVGFGLVALVLAWLAWRFWSTGKKLWTELEEARAELREQEPQPEGLAPGTVAPSFQLTDVRGRTQTLESLQARGRPLVIAFMEPTCGPCKSFLPRLALWQATLAERVTIAVITTGTVDSTRPIWEQHGLSDVLLDDPRAVFKAYRILGSPSAVAIERDGRVANSLAGGLHMPEVLIRLMLRRAARGEQPAASNGDLPKILHVEPDRA